MIKKLKALNAKKWISIFFFMLLLYLLQWSYFDFKNWLTDEKSVPLNALILTGDNTHVTLDKVREILIKQEGKLNFFYG